MKKYLLTLALLSASFSFIGQVAAAPCACQNGDPKAPQIQNCNEAEPKPVGLYGTQLKAGQCQADCDCAPGRRCVGVTEEAKKYGGAPGHCE